MQTSLITWIIFGMSNPFMKNTFIKKQSEKRNLYVNIRKTINLLQENVKER